MVEVYNQAADPMSVEISYDGPKPEFNCGYDYIGFDIKYLYDVIRNIDGAQVYLNKDMKAAALIKGTSGSALIMPVKLNKTPSQLHKEEEQAIKVKKGKQNDEVDTVERLG